MVGSDRLGIVVGAVQFRWSTVRWAVMSRWGNLRGLSGDFGTGEVSDRSREFNELWEQKWPEVDPLRHTLRAENERWVRFHSLPDGKRYADDDDERHEVLRRHRSVLEELSDGAPVESLVVIAPDYGKRDLASGWSKTYLPRAWPWGSIVDDSSDHPVYCWVASGLLKSELDDLLTASADGLGHPLILDARLTWIYCPYDGGADVLLPTAAERSELEQRHVDWLPDPY